ncbi:amidophosphoribosyltransferase [Longilinea arvoryzae]|uniref:Amidophosphoribosyltransferase n=1 Tax=Longilinea arvoryzae TaxID=360412 RepID=A0A0S7B757_9CHLR|nr:amidophosphoribosyltransferase [Longilinea arvoryzae]GAP12951.1 amidophosphoribosyltransferase [Longilinea arvoryzae]
MPESQVPIDWLADEHPQEECGVVGIYAPSEDVARMAYFGLYALQHRGQEAAGIAVADGHGIRMHKDIGLVSQVFSPERIATLKGDFAIGHVRYSTTGSSSLRNAQPFLIDTQYGPIAVAHNGNLVNASELRAGMLRSGVGFSSSSDSEVLTMMLAGATGTTWFERIQNTMRLWRGAYSLVILTGDQLYAVRDPWGIRPLTVGMLPTGGHAVASESGALRSLGCQAIREVKPGEVIMLTNTALSVGQALPPAERTALCTFEHIYFSRPDSFWDGQSVHQVRQRLGMHLAEEAPVGADVVVPVPDSSIPAAIGYATRSGVPYNDGFIKNRYIGRTFIEPTDSLRKMGVMLKYNVVVENVLNRRVVLIDDSIVRGNTTGPLVKMLRDAGASEVHVRITCPPIRHPCFMGVDMGTYDELVAHHHTVEEIRQISGADSLAFLSLEGMMKAIGRSDGYCNACYTGVYPFEVNAHTAKTGFEQAVGGQE